MPAIWPFCPCWLCCWPWGHAFPTPACWPCACWNCCCICGDPWNKTGDHAQVGWHQELNLYVRTARTLKRVNMLQIICLDHEPNWPWQSRTSSVYLHSSSFQRSPVPEVGAPYNAPNIHRTAKPQKGQGEFPNFLRIEVVCSYSVPCMQEHS